MPSKADTERFSSVDKFLSARRPTTNAEWKRIRIAKQEATRPSRQYQRQNQSATARAPVSGPSSSTANRPNHHRSPKQNRHGRPKKTHKELDSELDSYFDQQTPPQCPKIEPESRSSPRVSASDRQRLTSQPQSRYEHRYGARGNNGKGGRQSKSPAPRARETIIDSPEIVDQLESSDVEPEIDESVASDPEQGRWELAPDGSIYDVWLDTDEIPPKPPKPDPEFKPFKRLPIELRLIVARLAIDEEPRNLFVEVVFVKKYPRKPWNDELALKFENFERVSATTGLESSLFVVNREMRQEALRVFPYHLPLKLRESSPKVTGLPMQSVSLHMSARDNLSIINSEEALIRWNDNDPSPLNSSPFSPFSMKTSGKIYGEWAFRGLQLITLPSSIMRFWSDSPHTAKFLWDLPALKEITLLLQSSTTRDERNLIYIKGPRNDRPVILAESDSISRDLVSDLALVKEHDQRLKREDRLVKSDVLRIIAQINRYRREIEEYLSKRAKRSFEMKLVLRGSDTWKEDVGQYRN